MAIPITVDSLIKGRMIEGPRIEFKEGWNPERTLHSICAFANDIDNWGGGYIVIGIGENGDAKEIVGIPPESVDRIQKELLSLCNQIQPRYIPQAESCEYEGKTLFVIWVQGGDQRPYSCPVHLGKDTMERGYYIRKLSSTIRANHEEELELFEMSRNLPFDDRINMDAKVSDIDRMLVGRFLKNVNSALADRYESMDDKDLYASLGIIRGPQELLRPVNVGLMFFSRDPERFFNYARIEIVEKPRSTGEGMVEKTFTGPLDIQLTDALLFIKNYLISERIFKHADRAEADRIFNYPYAAIEEALSNAVYHKDYSVYEPITVVFHSDHIEITSIPGPDRSISDEGLRSGNLVSRHYRNRRIGDFLKELKLSEGRNTGVPTMIEAMRNNGSPEPVFLTDEDRSYFTTVLPIHPAFLVNVQRLEKGNTEESIIALIRVNGCMTVKEICTKMGYSGINIRISDTIKTMISDGRLRYLYPETPRSPKQRICLP